MIINNENLFKANVYSRKGDTYAFIDLLVIERETKEIYMMNIMNNETRAMLFKDIVQEKSKAVTVYQSSSYVSGIFFSVCIRHKDAEGSSTAI